jgi:hypothetical protein
MEKKSDAAFKESPEVCLYITMPHTKILTQRFKDASLLPFAELTNIINELGTTDFLDCERDVLSVVEVVDRALEFYANFCYKYYLGNPVLVVQKRDFIIELILKNDSQALKYLQSQKN